MVLMRHQGRIIKLSCWLLGTQFDASAFFGWRMLLGSFNSFNALGLNKEFIFVLYFFVRCGNFKHCILIALNLLLGYQVIHFYGLRSNKRLVIVEVAEPAKFLCRRARWALNSLAKEFLSFVKVCHNFRLFLFKPHHVVLHLHDFRKQALSG